MSPVPPQTQILQALKGFPTAFASFVVGLIVALLTRTECFLFVILGVLVGLATDSVWIGLAIPWGLYTTFYVLSQYMMLFASKADLFARLITESWNRKNNR